MLVQRVVLEMIRSDLEGKPYVEIKGEVHTNGGTFLEYWDEMNSEAK